ncbi:Phosphate-binding protein PstS 3 precursor [Micromonospora sp. MW-13]|uniref:phosphate ABC transporter substrate-binding protein PstS n=1 Tax=unclassified Micromonospora TaxID=2617518 RepID=UPI000E44CF85|nr:MULTISPECIES: phosphate ABC transporter substrate-binding protein PstS [unclassified Micromonospora]MCX4469780.1 phosphate ABC transporter substrate-binding protein PstS [Micromonospora sp. NBC_01655]RGC71076.1 Phosphate-binding protein PstS 3 precursor [Micromonospora sp. MW-13]
MKLQRHGTIACLALTAVLGLSACGSDNNEPASGASASGSAAAADCATGTLNAQGSSAQKNAMAEWIKAYQQKCAGSTINYEPSGSGAGIQAFIAGTADFAGSDSALKPEEQPQADAKCSGATAIHLPMVIGPVAVAYNVSGVDSLQLKPATLAKIFAGKVTKWDDPAIKADNPDAKLPSTTIQTVHRSDESGTTDNFTKFLAKTAGTDWTFENAKAWKAPGGTGAKGSDGVASSVKGADGSIGYMEWSFAENAGLKMAKIGNGAGEFAELTAENAGKTIAGAKIEGQGDDLKMSVDYNTKEAGAYPIVLVTYEIVCGKGLAADKLPLVKGLLGHAASSQGQAELTELGYAPLPESVRTKVEAAVKNLS